MTAVYPIPRWIVPLSRDYSLKTAPKRTVRKSPAKGAFNPPKHEIESFARCILPAIQAYFETEAGNREFAEWQAKQKTENKTA